MNPLDTVIRGEGSRLWLPSPWEEDELSEGSAGRAEASAARRRYSSARSRTCASHRYRHSSRNSRGAGGATSMAPGPWVDQAAEGPSKVGTAGSWWPIRHRQLGQPSTFRKGGAHVPLGKLRRKSSSSMPHLQQMKTSRVFPCSSTEFRWNTGEKDITTKGGKMGDVFSCAHAATQLVGDTHHLGPTGRYLSNSACNAGAPPGPVRQRRATALQGRLPLDLPDRFP